MAFNSGTDEPKPSFLSCSNDTNYFTEQALRGGYFRREMGGQGGGDFLRNYGPEREAIVREIEKERIRDEIIAREIRKRELEAEVRRELAMERDLMLRRAVGFSMPGMEPGQPMWSDYGASFMPDARRLERGHGVSRLSGVHPETGGFSRLPFQRRAESALTANVNVVDSTKAEEFPEVSNRGKVVILAKARSPSVPGTKRKVSSVGTSSDLAMSSLKKKGKREWSCALCQVSATCERGLNEHLEGKKHKSKQAELQSSKMAGKKNDKVAKKQLVKEGGSDEEVQKEKASHYRCEHCNVTCQSKSVMANHEKGKKHQAWLQRCADGGGSGQKKRKLVFLQCEHCDVKCLSKSVYAAHEKGKKHQAWLQQLNQNAGTVPTTTTATHDGLADETERVNEESGEGKVLEVVEPKEEFEEVIDKQ